MAPPLWPEHKNFLNTLNPKKNFLNFWGGGTVPFPDPFFSGEGHRLPTLHPIGAFGASNLASLALAPLHKILNTPLAIGVPGRAFLASVIEFSLHVVILTVVAKYLGSQADVHI